MPGNEEHKKTQKEIQDKQNNKERHWGAGQTTWTVLSGENVGQKHGSCTLMCLGCVLFKGVLFKGVLSQRCVFQKCVFQRCAFFKKVCFFQKNVLFIKKVCLFQKGVLFSTSHVRRLLERSHRSRGVRSAHPCHCARTFHFFSDCALTVGSARKVRSAWRKVGGLPHQSLSLKQTKELTTPCRGLLGKSPLHSQARAGGKRRKVRTEPKQTMCVCAKDTTHHTSCSRAHGTFTASPGAYTLQTSKPLV